MEDSIPITDFDKRFFPEITEEEKINFIMHSNEFERINMKFEEIQAQVLIPQRAKPAVSGQMRSLNWIFELASNPKLVPHPNSINPVSFDKLFPWFPKLHKNLMYDFSRQGEKLLNQIDYPPESELGLYRQNEMKLGHRIMPAPENIKKLLTQTFKEYAIIYHKYEDGINNPRIMENSDWNSLGKAIHTLALSVCCIKPFPDGSNRIARITENLLRLNIGLKFKIFTDKTLFLNEIWELQDSDFSGL